MTTKDIIRDKWNQMKDKIKNRWNLLTDDELAEMEGSYEELQELLQQKYGYEENDARGDIDSFIETSKLN